MANITEFDNLSARTHTVISQRLVHHHATPTALNSAPLIAPLVRKTWDLVENWNDWEGLQRRTILRSIRKRFDDALMLTGDLKLVNLAKDVDTTVYATSVTENKMIANKEHHAKAIESKSLIQSGARECSGQCGSRLLILHYHLFKNAGSSLDEMFRRNVGKSWREQEFAAPGGRTNAAAVSDWIKSHPEITVLSSHTALMPVPRIPDVEVLPVLFVRHPLLRLRSAYSFERRQRADTFGSKLAKRETFAGYISTLLDTKNHRQARNFQTFRLAYGTPEGGTEASRARRTMRSLPFVGLVEAYDASLERLEALIRPHVPDFTAVSVRKNVTTERPEMEIADQLAELREELGNALYDRLVAENAEDIALVNLIQAQYQNDDKRRQ